MTHFYYSTGRTDKSNSYYDTDRKIIIKSFDDVFEFKTISDLIEALKKKEN